MDRPARCRSASQFAGLRVVRGDVAAHGKFAAAVADDDFAFDNERSAGDAVVGVLVCGRAGPDHGSGVGIERDEAGVEQADIHLVVIDRDATVARTTTRPVPCAPGPGLPAAPGGKFWWPSCGSQRHFSFPVRASTANTTPQVTVRRASHLK